MSEPTGHAAFHLLKEGPTHSGTATGTKAQRRAVLKESMRHLDPKDVARHSKKNPSIVPTDSHLNTAFVNDGEGGFGVATAAGEVISYGNAREGAVRRKISKGWTTVNLFVVHLPKTGRDRASRTCLHDSVGCHPLRIGPEVVDSESLPGHRFLPGYTRRMRIGDLSAFAHLPERIDVDTGGRKPEGQSCLLRACCSTAAELVGMQ
jgi:hypothetical protein